MQSPTIAAESTVDLKVLFADDSAIQDLVEVTPQPESTPAVEALPESIDAVLATVETFDVAFAAEPLKADYQAFATEARGLLDPNDAAPRYVRLGMTGADLMAREHTLSPGSYDRAAVLKKMSHALRLCGVPESMNSPDEIVAVYWVSKLDRSEAGDENKPRSFATGPIPADWFGGNITIGVLRVLRKMISRVSEKNELELWEYRKGYESLSRDMINALRKGDLSIRKVEALIDYRRKVLKAEKDRADLAGKTPSQIADMQDLAAAKTRQAKLTKIGSAAHTLRKQAFDDLGYDKAEFTAYLENTQVITPRARSMEDIAVDMTPGDAKALMQALRARMAVDRSRARVLEAIKADVDAMVKLMFDKAKERAAIAQPTLKTGT